MGIRRPYSVVFILLLSSAASSWKAQEATLDPPRALEYSAPLLKGARQTAMDVDASGRIYLGGYICESTLPVTANAAQPTYGGGCDGFVAILCSGSAPAVCQLPRGIAAGTDHGNRCR